MAYLAAALATHDCTKRSTDLPLFYGQKEQDTVKPQQLLDCMERAAKVAKWDTPLAAGADAAAHEASGLEAGAK